MPDPLRRNIEKIPLFGRLWAGRKGHSIWPVLLPGKCGYSRGKSENAFYLAGFFGCIEFAGDGRGNDLSGQGNDVDERVQEITRQWHSIEEAATEFNIDLSQYERLFDDGSSDYRKSGGQFRMVFARAAKEDERIPV